MAETYIELRNRLNLLGYTQHFPVEASSVIECLLTDLIQTTKSLEYYKNISKEAIQQRDSLKSSFEPYKCENLNLVRENNELQRLFTNLKENSEKHCKSARNRIADLETEVEKLKNEVTRLKRERRDLKMMSTYTISAANKSALFDNNEMVKARSALKSKKLCKCNIPTCPCFDELADEIEALKDSLDAMEKHCASLESVKNDGDYDRTLLKLREIETLNEQLNEKLKETVANQHEAMVRALTLADKNSFLESELKSIDAVALRVESSCNKLLKEKTLMIEQLKTELESHERKRFVSREAQTSERPKVKTVRPFKPESDTAIEKQNFKDFQIKICELEKLINEVSTENRYLKGIVHGSESADIRIRDARIEALLEENSALRMTRDNKKSHLGHLREEADDLRRELHVLNDDLAETKSVNAQLKHLQKQTEKNMLETQAELARSKKLLNNSKVMIAHLEQRNKALQEELTTMMNEQRTMKQNLIMIDGERDRLIIECDNKAESLLQKDTKLSMMETELKSITSELNKSQDQERSSSYRLNLTSDKFDGVVQELRSVSNEKDALIRENKSLQDRISSVRAEHLSYIEKYKKSNSEIEAMKNQLQMYVSKIKSVEDIVQSKEEEMKSLLENFSSLAQEATALEMTNNSLELERTLKSNETDACMQRIDVLESQLKYAEDAIIKKDERITELLMQIKFLESDLLSSKRTKDEAQQKEQYCSDVVNTLNMQNKNLMDACNDLRSEKYQLEQRVDHLDNLRRRLEDSIKQGRSEIESLDGTLVKSRREIVDLKISLQNAMSESKVLREKIAEVTNRLQNIDFDAKESRERADSAIKQMVDLQKHLYARTADSDNEKSGTDTL